MASFGEVDMDRRSESAQPVEKPSKSEHGLDTLPRFSHFGLKGYVEWQMLNDLAMPVHDPE